MSKEFFRRHARYPSPHEGPKRLRYKDRPKYDSERYFIDRNKNIPPLQRSINLPDGKVALSLSRYTSDFLHSILVSDLYVVYNAEKVDIRIIKVNADDSENRSNTEGVLKKEGWRVLRQPNSTTVVGYRTKPKLAKTA